MLIYERFPQPISSNADGVFLLGEGLDVKEKNITFAADLRIKSYTNDGISGYF